MTECDREASIVICVVLVICVMLLSLCCSVVIILYCYCVALLLFVSSYVLIVCTVPLPPGVNPIAVDKYIYIYLKGGPVPLGVVAPWGKKSTFQLIVLLNQSTVIRKQARKAVERQGRFADCDESIARLQYSRPVAKLQTASVLSM